MPQGNEQRQMMEQMLDLGLFKKLAEFVLMKDQTQTQWLFIEKGALSVAIEDRLRTQLSDRLSLILQAINNYNQNSFSETGRAAQERQAILVRIRQEHDFVDGIENLYRAILQRQTIVALDHKNDERAMKPVQDPRTKNALEDVKRKAASDIEDT